jgi:hypothetical protein
MFGNYRTEGDRLFWCRCHKTFLLPKLTDAQNQLEHLARVVLLKEKAQYHWHSCIDLFRSAPFIRKILFTSFNTTRYLNEEVNCTEA